jgi:hypothetical protein
MGQFEFHAQPLRSIIEFAGFSLRHLVYFTFRHL